MSSSFKERMKMFQKAAEGNKPNLNSNKFSVKKGISEKTNKNIVLRWSFLIIQIKKKLMMNLY